MKTALYRTSCVETISLVNKQKLYEQFKRRLEAIYSDQNTASKIEGEFLENNLDFNINFTIL
jgi:hypothetical protein